MRCSSVADMPGVSVNSASGPPGARWSTRKPMIETSQRRRMLWPRRRSTKRIIIRKAVSARYPQSSGLCPVPVLYIPCVDGSIDSRLIANQALLRTLDRRVLKHGQLGQILLNDLLQLPVDLLALGAIEGTGTRNQQLVHFGIAVFH